MLPSSVLTVLFGQDREIIRCFLFGAFELTRDRINNDRSRIEIIQDRDYVDTSEEIPVSCGSTIQWTLYRRDELEFLSEFLQDKSE